MDRNLLDVGRRIRGSLSQGHTQRQLADRVGMTPDALSRALNGQRGFSILELTRIADDLDVDLTWLITGRPAPHHVSVAARHEWDPDRRTRSNPSAETDQATLDRVAGLYRSAYPEGPPPTATLPHDPDAVRAALGPEFVRTFAESLEATLGVDVVRVAGLGTAYSLTIGRRSLVVLDASPFWFRSNWSLAHELGHLVLGHHAADGGATSAKEHQADQFAAELLLPEGELARLDWSGMSDRELASYLWRTGVSTKALRTRLSYLGIVVSDAVAAALDLSTPQVVRRHAASPGARTEVATREQLAAARRLPVGLIADLTERVETGAAPPDALAWALAVDVDEIDFPAPDDATDAAAFETALRDRPGLRELRRHAATA